METTPGRQNSASVPWLVGSAGITVMAYLLLLGWNATRTLEPEEPGSFGTTCVGPHEPVRVVVLVGVLATVVVVGTWFRRPLLVSAVVIATGVLLFIVDAVTVDDTCADNNLGLLPVGVVVLLVGSLLGAAVLVVATQSLRNRKSS
jgi:hypothetical protein